MPRKPRRTFGLKDRFEKKYIPEPNSGCWLWTAAILKDRYGKDSYGVIGKDGGRGAGNLLAHRAAWIIYRHEIIPDNLDVMHKCDNRLCVNPDHLRLGTRAENMKDAKDKGRICANEARGALSKEVWAQYRDKMMEARPRGEAHHRTTLTNDQVRLIKNSIDETSPSLAKRLGVGISMVKHIRQGKSWRHIF